VILRDLAEEELPAAAALLGDAMRDNPLHLRVFGDDPSLRERALRRLFESALRRVRAKGAVEGAFGEGRLVGVCGRIRPGACRIGFGEKLRFLPSLLATNPWPTVLRILSWAGAWTKEDPDAPHWHLGPVGVLRARQGQGIGRELMKSFCERMDRERAAAYLETDLEANVRFYERSGFALGARRDVVGIPCWFMTRPALSG
jgi:ribosomal protein S18 acetylase RimI-like enzyme